MRIMVLGGAGKMGCIAVQDLTGDDRVDEVILADINESRADWSNKPSAVQKSRSCRSTAAMVAFEKAAKGVDVCLNATVYYANLPVMEMCSRPG